MTSWQKAVKYCAIAFAVLLIVSIIGGILTAVGSLNFVFGSSTSVGDMKTYEVSGDITGLYIEVGAAELVITEGNTLSVDSNLNNLTVKEDGGRLSIRETGHSFFADRRRSLVLSVPEGYIFEKAEISTGAGKVTVGSLSADELKLELGAGEVTVGSLTASKSADIDGGAGRIEINGGELHNPEIDIGAGELVYTGRIVGKGEINSGVGSSSIVLLGSRTDYRIDVSKGLGAVTVDGSKASDGDRIGSGENLVEIDNGVGAMTVGFKEAE